MSDDIEAREKMPRSVTNHKMPNPALYASIGSMIIISAKMILAFLTWQASDDPFAAVRLVAAVIDVDERDGVPEQLHVLDGRVPSSSLLLRRRRQERQQQVVDVEPQQSRRRWVAVAGGNAQPPRGQQLLLLQVEPGDQQRRAELPAGGRTRGGVVTGRRDHRHRRRLRLRVLPLAAISHVVVVALHQPAGQDAAAPGGCGEGGAGAGAAAADGRRRRRHRQRRRRRGGRGDCLGQREILERGPLNRTIRINVSSV
jgi:hypothetical protein